MLIAAWHSSPAQSEDSRNSNYTNDPSIFPPIIDYLSCGDTGYLQKVIEEDLYKPNKCFGLIDFAEFLTSQKLPESSFERTRLEFLLANKQKLLRCLKKITKTPSSFTQKIGWASSDLYVEGLFKLIRGILKDDEEIAETIEPLRLKKGEVTADIGFGDGQVTVAMANKVGKSGKAIGIEISPALVDFLNFSSKRLHLPQLKARLCVDTDIAVPKDSLDAAFISFVFSNLRDEAQPWTNSIFKAMKPGGRVIILQHYDPVDAADKKELIERFLHDDGALPVSKNLPCRWRSPDVVKKLCTNAGFKVVSLKEEIGPDHVYLLEVKK